MTELPNLAEQRNELISHPGQQRNGNSDRTSKHSAMESMKEDINVVVRDRFKIVFLIFILHGMGTLMPWNMFITANSYFVDFKLNDESMKESRKNFLTYVGIAANVPNVLFNALNIFVQFSGETLGVRIVGSLILEIIIFLLTIILAMINTTSWVSVFFGITMASVVIINMASGVYQNSAYGLATKLPMEYTMAIIVGNNISGTFTAIILIITITASPHPRIAAIYYFITALVVLLFCVDTFLALPLNKFYRHYDRLARRRSEKSVQESVVLTPLQVLRKIWPQCLNVFLVFFVTLTIFPAMCANVHLIDQGFFISPKYFTAITCFLSFNLSAMVGSFLPSWFKWPGPKYLWIPVVARFMLIPYFMFCNYVPTTRSLPVLIENDWAYSLMVVVMGVSSGYFSSLAMMYAPGYVKDESKAIAGMIAAFCLVFGVFCGVNFTFAVRWLVDNM